MKILVTGGAGYIGSHACKVLARRGFEPIVFDNLSRGNRWAVKWGPLELGDIANSVRLRTVLEQYRPAALMHFAAYAYVGELVEDPLLYYQNNVAASAALLPLRLALAKSIPLRGLVLCSFWPKCTDLFQEAVAFDDIIPADPGSVQVVQDMAKTENIRYLNLFGRFCGAGPLRFLARVNEAHLAGLQEMGSRSVVRRKERHCSRSVDIIRVREPAASFTTR